MNFPPESTEWWHKPYKVKMRAASLHDRPEWEWVDGKTYEFYRGWLVPGEKGFRDEVAMIPMMGQEYPYDIAPAFVLIGDLVCDFCGGDGCPDCGRSLV